MNPWTALMEPIRTKPGKPVRSVPATPSTPPRFHTSDGLTFKAGAALVLTGERCELVPIVVLEFAA